MPRIISVILHKKRIQMCISTLIQYTHSCSAVGHRTAWELMLLAVFQHILGSNSLFKAVSPQLHQSCPEALLLCHYGEKTHTDFLLSSLQVNKWVTPSTAQQACILLKIIKQTLITPTHRQPKTWVFQCPDIFS